MDKPRILKDILGAHREKNSFSLTHVLFFISASVAALLNDKFVNNVGAFGFAFLKFSVLAFGVSIVFLIMSIHKSYDADSEISANGFENVNKVAKKTWWSFRFDDIAYLAFFIGVLSGLVAASIFLWRYQ